MKIQGAIGPKNGVRKAAQKSVALTMASPVNTVRFSEQKPALRETSKVCNAKLAATIHQRPNKEGSACGHRFLESVHRTKNTMPSCGRSLQAYCRLVQFEEPACDLRRPHPVDRNLTHENDERNRKVCELNAGASATDAYCGIMSCAAILLADIQVTPHVSHLSHSSSLVCERLLSFRNSRFSPNFWIFAGFIGCGLQVPCVSAGQCLFLMNQAF